MKLLRCFKEEESMANHRSIVRKSQTGSNKPPSSGDVPEEITRVRTPRKDKNEVLAQ